MVYNIEKEKLLELLAEAFDKGLDDGDPKLGDKAANDVLNKFLESKEKDEKI